MGALSRPWCQLLAERSTAVIEPASGQLQTPCAFEKVTHTFEQRLYWTLPFRTICIVVLILENFSGFFTFTC